MTLDHQETCQEEEYFSISTIAYYATPILIGLLAFATFLSYSSMFNYSDD